MDVLRAMSWMSPALGLALVAALVAALIYVAAARKPLWSVPLYWVLALIGFAAGQGLASRLRPLPVIGDLAVGAGALACIMLFAIMHLLTLWYTGGHRARTHAGPRRERLHR